MAWSRLPNNLLNGAQDLGLHMYIRPVGGTPVPILLSQVLAQSGDGGDKSAFPDLLPSLDL
jgi:hypothetical protein